MKSHSRQHYICEFVGKNKKVLDVGCGEGDLAKLLSEHNQCEIWGIEISENSAKKADRYCKTVINEDVESVDHVFPENYYDVILFADVLEHLKDPLEVLVKFKRYINENGIIICTLPNIAHISIRIALMQGKWSYEDSGILDETHLRFFTKTTATELIEKANYRTESMKISPRVPNVSSPWLANLLFNFFPKLFAYQFIIKAKP